MKPFYQKLINTFIEISITKLRIEELGSDFKITEHEFELKMNDFESFEEIHLNISLIIFLFFFLFCYIFRYWL